MKPPQEGRNTGAPSLRGLQGRYATWLNGQAAKEDVSALWRGGLDAGKYLWRSGREKCFSLDIPFNRTSGWTTRPESCWWQAGNTQVGAPIEFRPVLARYRSTSWNHSRSRP